MKLYATVASERASKGQGGNDFLEIELFYGNAKESKLLATLKVKPVADGYGLYLDGAMIRHSEQVERKRNTPQCKRCISFTNDVCDNCGETKEKAKRQKGECKNGCAYHSQNEECTDIPS